LGTDYGIPEEILVPLYSAIGELVFSWALVEANVNYWIAIAYQDAGGKHLKGHAHLPWGMKAKLRFLRLCFTCLPTLKPFASTAKPLLTRAKMIAKTRDLVVHGVASDYRTETLEIMFVSIDRDTAKTMQTSKESWVNIRKILDDSGEAIAVGREALRLSERLLETLVPDQEAKELFRSLSGR
jgi:hypothetical protein